MKAALLFFMFLAGGIFLSALAQVPQGSGATGHPSMPSYRHTSEGEKLDFVITGTSFTNLDSRNVLVTQFDLKSFHNGDPKKVQLIAQAPQCAVDVSTSVGSDK